MNLKKIDELAKLLETYSDPIKENIILKEKFLVDGFSLQTKILTKSPSLISLITQKGIPHNFIKYFTSYNSHRISNYKLCLFYDDLWDIKISNEYYDFPIFSIDGHKLVNVIKQGVNGILPKILKYNLKKNLKDMPNISEQTFNFHIGLNISHDNYKKTIRYQDNLKNSIPVETEVSKLLKSTHLFQNLLTREFTIQDKALINERLKLWNVQIPIKKFQEDYVFNIVNNLPINNFGITDMIQLRNISKSFSSKVSNEVMLSGQLGGNFIEDRLIHQLNDYLKKAINY